jgi:hypothetical protein
VPEPTECPAQTGEGNLGCPLPPVGSLAPMSHQLGALGKQRWGEQKQEEAIRQGDEPKQLATRLPALESQGFDVQFGFLKAEPFLNFPSTGIGEGHLPGLFGGFDHCIGKQVPGFTPFALSHTHQPELPNILRVTHGQGEDARAAVQAKMGIPQQPGFSPSPLAACDLPGFARLACCIEELVAFFPPHHQAHPRKRESREPRTLTISPILRRGAACAPRAVRSCVTGPLAACVVVRQPLFRGSSSAWRPPGADRFCRPATHSPIRSPVHARGCRRVD